MRINPRALSLTRAIFCSVGTFVVRASGSSWTVKIDIPAMKGEPELRVSTRAEAQKIAARLRGVAVLVYMGKWSEAAEAAIARALDDPAARHNVRALVAAGLAAAG